MRNIVVLGPTGQVGFELVGALGPLGRVATLSRQDVCFNDVQALENKLCELKPDIIVNAAAWTAVDKAEIEPEQAMLLNCGLPSVLATVAAKLNAWLVHYSSDYVYPGSGTTLWQETDATGPLSVYGKSKLAGDKAIQANCSKYLIFRTSWVYAARGTNFLLTMLKLAKSRESLSVVSDQIGAPTPARLIAQVTTLALHQILWLEQQGQDAKEYAGLYHLASNGHCSWYDFAVEIFRLAEEHGIPLVLNPKQVKAITSADFPTQAQRPLNSRLNLHKIEQTFGLQLPCWKQQLALTFNECITH